MPKFRKKPVVIEAIQFLGRLSYEEMCNEWAAEFFRASFFIAGAANQPMALIIKTLEGDHSAHIGDWIIKGIKGEFYPCKNDIFEATYELAG